MRRMSYFIQLTKPTIMLLVIFTGATALVMEGSALVSSGRFWLILAALYLTGGSANALNQCLEREIDRKMTRTSARRPLPQGHLGIVEAYAFSIIAGLSGVVMFGLLFNWFSAALALGTILFYSFFYTLYLKPNTDQNIVIGGAAGAMGPIIAWAAVSGEITLTPVLLFLLVFLWTPPHFWALALFCKEDYEKIGMPMMPVVRGDDETLRWILYYSLALIALSFVLLTVSGVGVLYALTAVGLGGEFLRRVLLAKRRATPNADRRLFGFSLIYLFGLFLSLIVDVAILNT